MTLQDALRGSAMSEVRRAVLMDELARLNDRIRELRPRFDGALDVLRLTGSYSAQLEVDGLDAQLLPLVSQSEHIYWILETENLAVC